ncbi:Tetratricopeptide TPR_1 repeat-containing protein [Desulfurispirillum indicum S5]|uniref:Tetratricopeptide TPR_1 repeat-containing protein n=1 Tax=Desulfurispirillum indicum (strain ATCC BAA-1389 / DSM 22839 / S5) TaxID=653733 RepID=E6W5B2_DESIS|nr:tetratricopeptide repeat protein [Desulfurispirillum indicum]ADU67191.1 Tetratricopeptide TPR_1 repeat-containing protein [Desulfurispirillum indicum S5]
MKPRKVRKSAVHKRKNIPVQAAKKSEWSRWRWDLMALGVLCTVGAMLYGHTLQVPWYLDDLVNIVENPAIRSLPEALTNVFHGARGFAELTFALNYAFGSTQVTGYHLVNITIHLLTACLVFGILKRVFRQLPLFVFGGALIFLAHPLQTQAVTYIVQRMSCLAGLFFFLAVYLFLLFRESKEGARNRWVLYVMALLSGALAVLTKQNTAVLPLALILLDRFFIQERHPVSWRRLLFLVAPFALVPLWLGVKMLLVPLVAGEGIDGVGGMPDLSHLQNNSPLTYLVTQFSVIFLYIRLLFLPYGQALEYDVAIVQSIFTLHNGLGLLGILALLVAAVLLRRREPLICVGILWFFLGLVVESSIIPLDPVFEHRLYISMFGFVLVVMAAIQRIPRSYAVAVLLTLVTVLSVLTWQRNSLWNDPVAFYEDNLQRAPSNERIYVDLGNLYMAEGRVGEARLLYERALEINPRYVPIHINLSRAYAAELQYKMGIDILLEGIRLNPWHYRLYNNIGTLYNAQGNFHEANSFLRKGVALEPNDPTMLFNLALSHDRLGQLDEAVRHYRRSVSLAPDPMVYFNLGLVLHRKGELREALQAFMSASRLNPAHAGSLYNGALIYLELGDVQGAYTLQQRLQRLDPALAQSLLGRLPSTGRQ